MKIIPVYLRDMQDAKHLVQAAEACKKEVDLLCGRYVVDAKSMLGVFSLPCFDDVKMRVEDKDAKILIQYLEQGNVIRMEENLDGTDKSEIKKNRTGAGSFEIGNRMEAGGSLQTTDHD